MLLNNAVELDGEEPLTVSLLPEIILECSVLGVCILYLYIGLRFVFAVLFSWLLLLALVIGMLQVRD